MAVRSPPASGYNRDHVFALRVTATPYLSNGFQY